MPQNTGEPARDQKQNRSRLNLCPERLLAHRHPSQPLKASIKRTKVPAFHPRLRNTLVAPMFPLPLERMSTPLCLATRKPVGIEPNKNPVRAARK